MENMFKRSTWTMLIWKDQTNFDKMWMKSGHSGKERSSSTNVTVGYIHLLKTSSLSIHMKSQGWKPQVYTFLVIFPFLFLGFISYSLELLLKKVFDLAGITSSAGRIVVVNSELSSQQSTDVLLILFEIQDLQMS